MNYLVDSHIVIWLSLSPEKVSWRERNLMAGAEGRLLVSVASLWEIAIKHAAGRLHFPWTGWICNYPIWACGFSTSPCPTPWPLPHCHPSMATRSTACWWPQARMEDLVLVTEDGIIPTYDVRTLSARE